MACFAGALPCHLPTLPGWRRNQLMAGVPLTGRLAHIDGGQCQRGCVGRARRMALRPAPLGSGPARGGDPLARSTDSSQPSTEFGERRIAPTTTFATLV